MQGELMSFVSDTGSTFERFLNKHGSTANLQLKTVSYDDDDYDDETLVSSGAVIDSYKCVMVNISAKPYSDDYSYVQQGLVKLTDKKLYCPGAFPVAENATIVINSGSYWVKKFDYNYISGTNIYSRVFIRTLADSET